MQQPSRDGIRRDLLDIYRHALAAVAGRRRVRDALTRDPVDGPVRLVAIGKAAGSMAEGAQEALGSRIEAALIITKYGHAAGPDDLPATRIESAHPVPDHNSLAAGQALVDFIALSASGTMLLFLISGGTSALAELPKPGIDLARLQRAYRWMLGSGLPIAAVNRLRVRLSRIKGGQLAAGLGGRRARQLLISDVPDDDPATIGSGLLTFARSESGAGDDQGLPGWLQSLLAEAAGASRNARDAAPVDTRIIATSRDACMAAAARAHALGYPARVHGTLLSGDAVGAGRALAAALSGGPPGLSIHGGETVVRLPAHPGRGGRCQSLALAAAIDIAGREDLYLLAAGTDGSDGSGEAAGALIDGGTIARGVCGGLDAARCLRGADAGSFLEIAGDLIYTGPGNTNVMDLVLGLRTAAGPRRDDG
jgi:glycerate 2-kinase